jgi:phospholipid transport system substrate-binding protein
MSKHVMARGPGRSSARATRLVSAAFVAALGPQALTLALVSSPAFVYAAPQPAAGALGPKATLQRLNGAVDKQLRQKTEPGSAEEKKSKEEVKQRASELLDYAELTKRALGEHWEKMPAAKRDEFVKTLQELIERNYIKQLRTNLDYEVSYGDEQIEQPAQPGAKAEAKVTTTIKIATRGKSTSALIEYRMIRHDPPAGAAKDAAKDAGRWMVYDVITDELSLVRNYRSQFQRIIASSGYDGLLSRMKTKLAEEQAKDKEANKEKEPAKATGH